MGGIGEVAIPNVLRLILNIMYTFCDAVLIKQFLFVEKKKPPYVLLLSFIIIIDFVLAGKQIWKNSNVINLEKLGERFR